MGLSWKKLEKIVSGKSAQKASGEETAHPANILLQIVLPMVLILGFVVFTRVVVLEGIVEEYAERPGWEQYDKAYLELQKQILMKKWEKLKSERREYFKIDLFLYNDARIKKVADGFVSNKLVDDHFKEMCRKTNDCIGNEKSQGIEINSLYNKVLEDARGELKRLEKEENFSYRGIKDRDIKFIRTQIGEFINGLIKDVTVTQHKTITMILACFLDNPRRLEDDELSNLIEEYMWVAEKDKVLYAERIYDRLFEKLKTDLKSQDCFFLEETWRRMKLLGHEVI